MVFPIEDLLADASLTLITTDGTFQQIPAFISADGYRTTPAGVANTFITTPDPGPLPAEYTIVWDVVGPTGVTGSIVGQHQNSTTDRSWLLSRGTGPALIYATFSAGTATPVSTRTNTAPAVTGGRDRTAVSVTADNGTGKGVLTSWTYTAGAWSVVQTFTLATSYLTWDSSLPVRIGNVTATVNPFQGDIYSVEMRSGLDPTAGTVLWRFDGNDCPTPIAAINDTLDSDADADGIADGWKAFLGAAAPVNASRTVSTFQRIVASPSALNSAYGIETATGIPCVAGDVINGRTTVQYTTANATAVTGSWFVRFYTAADVFISASTNTGIVANAAPTIVPLTQFTAPANTAYARLVFRVVGGTGADGTLQGTLDVYDAKMWVNNLSYTDPRGRVWTKSVPDAIVPKVIDPGSAFEDEVLIVDWYEWSGQPESYIEMRFGDVWERVQCDVQSLTASVGRDLTSEAVEAGKCTIRFDNRSGRFTDWQDQVAPINEATEIRLRVRYPVTTSTLGEQVVWWGYVQEWEQEWDYSNDTVVVSAVDAVSLLVEQGGTLGWTAGGFNDTIHMRLTHLLSRAGLSYRRLYAEQGRGGLINPELTDQSVLNEIQRVADTDGGHFFVECDGDGYYFVYLNRERFIRPPIDVQGVYVLPLATTTSSPSAFGRREGPAPQIEAPIRTVGQFRLAQPVIPLFSDLCGITTPEAYPYTDLEWKYRGWEIPSIVAVSNQSPKREEDADGEPLTPLWQQLGGLASGAGRRHNVQEWTNLEFITQDQANNLANTYAAAFSRSNIDISMLEVHPVLDDRLWDLVGTLRQGDWITVERHLVTDRLTAMCCIEGIEWELTPTAAGGEPQWKITYRLHSLTVRAEPIPPEQRVALPPTVADRPPLPDVPKVMSLAPFGTGSTFTERGAAYDSLFSLRITDPAHGEHTAFARNEEIGTVQLPLLAAGTYSGDVITRQFGGIALTPGNWQVWVRDRTVTNRFSDTQFISIADWETQAITAVEWLPDTTSTISYTDDRYPEMATRVFATGRGGVQEMPVLSWTRISSRNFEAEVSSKLLAPGEWDIWVQDPVLNRRQSPRVTYYKAATAPANLRIGDFHPLDEWDENAWDSIPVICDLVTDATGYEFEMKDLVEGGEPRTRNEVAPATDVTGGRVTSGLQVERRWEVRVRSKVNGEESGWSNSIVIETGFPAFISKGDMPLTTKVIPITTRNQVAGMIVSGIYVPPGAQSVDPDADRFVGTEVTRLQFTALRSQIVFGGVADIKLNFTEGSDDPAHANTSNLRHVIGTAAAAAPGASPTVPDGDGAFVTQNPSTPDDVSMPVRYILGSQSRFIGIRLEGIWWGTSGPTQPGPGQGGWIRADLMAIEGKRYTWMPARYPKQLGRA